MVCIIICGDCGKTLEVNIDDAFTHRLGAPEGHVCDASDGPRAGETTIAFTAAFEDDVSDEEFEPEFEAEGFEHIPTRVLWTLSQQR